MNNSPIIGVTPLWDAGSLQWLEDAGMIHRCYNTDATGLPMEGNAIESTFKVYITDIGLLVTMLETTSCKEIWAASKVLSTRT